MLSHYKCILFITVAVLLFSFSTSPWWGIAGHNPIDVVFDVNVKAKWASVLKIHGSWKFHVYNYINKHKTISSKRKVIWFFFLIWNENQIQQHHMYRCMFFPSKALDTCTWNQCCRRCCRISLLRSGMDFYHMVWIFPSSLLKQGRNWRFKIASTVKLFDKHFKTLILKVTDIKFVEGKLSTQLYCSILTNLKLPFKACPSVLLRHKYTTCSCAFLNKYGWHIR